MHSISSVKIYLLMVFIFSGISTAYANEFRFPVGLGYSSKGTKVMDIYVSNLEWEGYSVSSSPYAGTGLFTSPYYQLDSGLGFGFTLGPTIMIATNTGNGDYFSMPVGPDVRYAFFQGSNFSPYVKAGGRYPIASGTWVKGSTPGFFLGVGVEFLRTRRVGVGFEIGFDSSKVEIENLETGKNEKIRTGQITAALFAVF
jgi:hypothetical protein